MVHLAVEELPALGAPFQLVSALTQPRSELEPLPPLSSFGHGTTLWCNLPHKRVVEPIFLGLRSVEGGIAAMISAVCWVPRGVAKPVQLEEEDPTEDELAEMHAGKS